MTCLETTFIIDVLRGDSAIKSLLEEFEKTKTSLTVAAPSIMEIWTGAILSKYSESEKAKVKDFISSLIVLPLDEKSATEAGEIEAELIRSNVSIDVEDVMIAGIARAHGEKLVTRDRDYAQIPGLRVLKY